MATVEDFPATWGSPDTTLAAIPVARDQTQQQPNEGTPPKSPPHSISERGRHGLDWPVVIWVSLLHIGALAAPFFVSWQGLAAWLALWWVTGSLGVCLGYHRLLTHGSLQTYRPVRWFFALLGGLSGEGSALTWVAVHREHHVHSDQDGDPHTPKDGGLWSHMLWMAPSLGKRSQAEVIHHYALDIERDPGMRFLDRTFLLWHFVLGLALYGLGLWVWDVRTAISLVVWGMFVRLIWVLHVTWFVNSACHIWGYRNYETTDNSRNLWWVGLLAFGEGWHNNHHAYQRMARHGHKWWEIDLTYWSICLLERMGLAWKVVKDPPRHSAGLIRSGRDA